MGSLAGSLRAIVSGYTGLPNCNVGGGEVMSELIGKITVPWMPSLLVNTAYANSDMKKGHTRKCLEAMWQITMMLGPAVGYSWKWDGKRRIDVAITLWNHRSADPDGLSKSIDDAIKGAIGVDDLFFDTHCVGDSDKGETRIEIELSYAKKVN